MNILDSLHIIGGLPPATDAFSGTVATDIFEVSGAGAFFVYWMGTNAGVGNAQITVLACSTNTATATTAIPFKYKVSTTFDTWGAWTEATATGIATSTTSNNIYLINAEAGAIASTGYKYVKLVSVEAGGDAVYGCVLAGVINPRYQAQPSSLID